MSSEHVVAPEPAPAATSTSTSTSTQTPAHKTMPLAVPPAGPPKESIAARRIADMVRTSILAGELSPGDRIRQEGLADQSGASRIPVREALRLLQAEGLVTLVANSGAWVSGLTQEACSEVYQIRERLEPLLLAHSAPLLTDADLDRLDALARQMEANDDVEVFLRLDREFHLLSYSRATTTLVGDIIHRLWNTTQHYRRAYTHLVGVEGIPVTHMEHHMLVDALLRRDVVDAEQVLAGHIRRTRLELARHPEVFPPSASSSAAR